MRPPEIGGPAELLTATGEPGEKVVEAVSLVPEVPNAQRTDEAQIYALTRGGSRSTIVEVVADDTFADMWRIAWPDIGLSPPANLSRCKDASREWAEREMLTDLRKKRGVGALKLLDNFSWSPRHVRLNRSGVATAPSGWRRRI